MLNKGGGSEFEKRLPMFIKRRKNTKQAVIKHITKVHTEARYFALKRGPE